MPPKVSEAHKEERRAELLLSALQCFSQKGYEATKVDDIVQNAGVSKGMIYNYFQSKMDIFIELLKDRTEEFFAGIEELFSKHQTATDKLRALHARYRDLPMNDERRQWITVYLEFWLSSSRNDEQKQLMEAHYDRFVHFVVDVIEDGKRTGEFREDVDATVASMLYWSLVDGISLHYSQIGEYRNYARIWPSSEDMFFHYLKAKV